MDYNLADRDWLHLHPAFRTKLVEVVRRVEKYTGVSWILIEGYRSNERQLWLYGQGRTRPGNIVTWTKDPRWHGCGLAGDLAPVKNGKVWYTCPREYWVTLRDIYKSLGLGNPALSKGDLGHVQSLSSDFRPKALAWVKRGFKDG